MPNSGIINMYGMEQKPEGVIEILQPGIKEG